MSAAISAAIQQKMIAAELEPSKTLDRMLEPSKTVIAAPYSNQEIAAMKVIAFFKSRKQYVMLLAQMQSGKTGTFQTVARKMLEEKLVDRVIIISGSNEIELLNQARADTQRYNPDDKRIKVIFRQHFDATIPFELKRTLIIVEESHLDQSNGQQMDKFLKRMGLSLNGELPTPSTYILSVSATPFSEFSSLTYNKSGPKKIVKLEPAASYRGVEYFLKNECIHATFDFMSRRFAEIVLSFGNKYNIVRAQDYQQRMIARSMSGLCDIKYFTQDKKTIAISDLETAPTRPTILFVNGLLRCGKVVPKKNIGFVWESSEAPDADTSLQGLLGRMCGYYAESDASPHIFVSPVLLEKKLVGGKMMNELERFVEFMNSPHPEIMPTTGKNLVGVMERVVKDKEPAPAFLFAPGTLFTPGFETKLDICKAMRDEFRAVTEKLRDANRRSTYLNEEQRAEIDSILCNKAIKPNGRLFGATSSSTQKRYMDELIEKTPMGLANTQLLYNQAAPVTIGLCYIKDGPKAGCVYVVFQLSAKRCIAYKKELIAESTNFEIFSQPLTKGADVRAGCTYALTSAIDNNPAELEAQLSEMVSDYVDYLHGIRRGFVNNQVTAVGTDCINLNRCVYSFAILRDMFKRIGERFDVTVSATASGKFADVIRLTKIEWNSK